MLLRGCRAASLLLIAGLPGYFCYLSLVQKTDVIETAAYMSVTVAFALGVTGHVVFSAWIGGAVARDLGESEIARRLQVFESVAFFAFGVLGFCCLGMYFMSYLTYPPVAIIALLLLHRTRRRLRRAASNLHVDARPEAIT